jgi:hypothetical protein
VQSAPKVEVGDSVRYRYTDAPGDELFHMIVDSESKPDLGLINRDTVVAKALLGMEVGQVREVILPIGARSLEVTEVRKHQTQGATPPGGADNFRLVTEINEGFGEDDRNTNNEGATRSGQLVLKGQIFAYRNAKEGMLIVLRDLANADSTLLQKCAIHPDAQGQSRRYIARTTAELYPNRPDLRRHHEVLPGGWMVATNLNNELKLKIVRLAAKLAGLDLTKDLLIDF